MHLTASQRVTLIKVIAKELNKENRSHIDATLSQFSLPVANTDLPDEAYILRMIDDAGDKELIELAAHLGYSLKGKEKAPEPGFWKEGKLRLFISHLAKHKSFAGKLKRLLSTYGISCFVAHDDIAPTREWEDEIITALDTCDALIALMHENFHASFWADQEIGFAMGRGVPVCSVNLGQTPYGFIGRYQAFKSDDSEVKKLASQLFSAYCKDIRTERKMAESVVQLFETSNSFANAMVNRDLLESLPGWDTSFNGRLRQAAKNNSQVREAFGVPESIERLIKRKSR